MKGLVTNHIGTTHSKQGVGFLGLGLPRFMAGVCEEDTRSDFFFLKQKPNSWRQTVEWCLSEPVKRENWGVVYWRDSAVCDGRVPEISRTTRRIQPTLLCLMPLNCVLRDGED